MTAAPPTRCQPGTTPLRDLVARLRWPEGLHGSQDHPVSVRLRIEAADEIERLRRDLRHWREECGKLHARTAPAQRCDAESASDRPHYLSAIRLRLEQLYDASADDPRLREHLSDEIDWVDEQIAALSPDQGTVAVASAEIAEGLEVLRDLEVAWLTAHLSDSIANLGYPVGMGMAPHPEQIKKAATTLFERYVKMIAMARGLAIPSAYREAGK